MTKFWKKILFTSFRRRLVDEDLKNNLKALSGKVLDLGGGQTRGEFPSGDKIGWVVLDENRKLSPSVVGDAQELPFKNNSFDAVKCSELTGYLFEPIKMVREIKRVLKKGGIAVITSPFLTPYDHAQHDGVRLTSAWWGWAARETGLQLIKVNPQGLLLTTIADFEKYWISHWWKPVRYLTYLFMYPFYELLFWWEKTNMIPNFFHRFTTGFLVIMKKTNK